MIGMCCAALSVDQSEGKKEGNSNVTAQKRKKGTRRKGRNVSESRRKRRRKVLPSSNCLVNAVVVVNELQTYEFC